MATSQAGAAVDAAMERTRQRFSRAAVALLLVVLAGSWFLISPGSAGAYPGARPWGEFSVLHALTQLMSLGGWFPTARGVEIKNFVFYLGAALGLVLLSARSFASAGSPTRQRTGKSAWFYGQLLLTAWVGLSLYSAWWSSDNEVSLSQGAIYAMSIAWAVSLAWTLERRHLPAALAGIVIISCAGAILCIWYYHERNPLHHPGFPVGNPLTLTACMLPAMFICGCHICGAIGDWRDQRVRPPRSAWGAALALIPLIWCMWLTDADSSHAGVIAGAVAVALLTLRRRWKIVLVALVVLVLSVALWWATTPGFERFADSRPTVRFRLYAWRYASEIWSQFPYHGAGAGVYTRFARKLAIGDRALDPAAFMGDWTAHAHNELFEIIAEIGLIGSVLFVGGYIATAAAAAALTSRASAGPQRWLLLGLFGGFVALLGELCFSVGLRLPGQPAVFYTVLGLIWAACRCASRAPVIEQGRFGRSWFVGPAGRRVAVGTAALLLALGTAWLAVRDWSGARREFAASAQKREAAEPDLLERTEALLGAAAADYEVAAHRLLDPGRKLFAAGGAVQCRLELARVAFVQYLRAGAASPARTPVAPPATQAVPAVLTAAEYAEAAARRAYFEAEALDDRAPTLMRMQAVAAHAAEIMVELARQVRPNAFPEWSARRIRAWLRQKSYDPYDVETLLAICRQGEWLTLNDQVGLLRDALRAGNPLNAEWAEVFAGVSRAPGFSTVLERYELQAGPIDPQTALDSLIVSMAPEMYRLVAYWRNVRGEWAKAAQYAARAARLYEPMRPRFPVLQSIALAEQAQYTLNAQPRDPAAAIALLEQALHQLPVIQETKFDEIAQPFRLRLARYLLAAGREHAAREVLETARPDGMTVDAALADSYLQLVLDFVRRPASERPDVERWIRAVLTLRPTDVLAWSWKAWLAAESGDPDAVTAVLRDAAATGVSAADQERIRRSLCVEFPDICATLRQTP